MGRLSAMATPTVAGAADSECAGGTSAHVNKAAHIVARIRSPSHGIGKHLTDRRSAYADPNRFAPPRVDRSSRRVSLLGTPHAAGRSAAGETAKSRHIGAPPATSTSLPLLAIFRPHPDRKIRRTMA